MGLCSQSLPAVLGRDAAEARAPRGDYRLRPCLDAELAEDAGDVVAHRLRRDAETAGDLRVVGALSDELEHVTLAIGEAGEGLACDDGLDFARRVAEEVAQLLEEDRPRGFVLLDDVVSSLEGNEVRVGNQRRENEPFLEGDDRVVTRVPRRKAADPAELLPTVLVAS